MTVSQTIIDLIVAGEKLADAARNMNVASPHQMTKRAEESDQALAEWHRAKCEAMSRAPRAENGEPTS